MRFIRRFFILALLAGIGVKLLRSVGLLGGGECTPACACSMGELDCTCGHATCLAPGAV